MFAGLVALAFFLVCALGMLCGASSAYAVSHADTSEDKDLVAAQEKVEESAAALDEAYSNVKKLKKRVAENEARIKEVKEELPAQKEEAKEALRILYKTSNDAPGMIDMLFSAGSVTEFFNMYEYLQHIQESSVNAITRLSKLEAELSESQDQLKEDLENAQKVQDDAYVALEEAKAERQKAQEDAIAAAEAAARAQAAKEKKEAEQKAEEKAEKKKSSSSSSKSKSSSSSSKSDSSDSEKSVKAIDKGDVNWDMSKSKFVSIWTKRINSYLKGSALAGTGKYFAKAAWKYGVDPRWSPAISCIESGKGASCFKSHNAWGWGNVSWSSWSEAIDSHIRGLARGYGYTISVSAAQKYCPPNWRNWYNNVCSEMKKM